MYGGIEESGAIADKLWYFDSTAMTMGYTYSLRFEGVNRSTWNSTLFRQALFTEWEDGGFNCHPATTLYIEATKDEPGPPGGPQFMRVDISIDPWMVMNPENAQAIQHPDTGEWISPPCIPAYEYWYGGWSPIALWRDHWADAAPRLFNGTRMAGATLAADQLQGKRARTPSLVVDGDDTKVMLEDANEPGRTGEEFWMDAFAYNDLETCRSGNGNYCMRGHCQGSTAATAGTAAFNVRGEAVYCYRPTFACPTDYACAHPRNQHGHAMLPLQLGGQLPTLLIVGAEVSNIRSSAATLTTNIYAGFFTPTTVVFSKLRTGNSTGGTCEYVTNGETCPTARRDAAMAIMDNKGSSNGYLLLFGGVTGVGTTYTSPLLSYLKRSRQLPVTALNDLWYLDLEGLKQECLMQGTCTSVLPWKLIEVPGNRPSPRWGAAMSLDSFATLFVTGGATYDTTMGYSELDDLFVFRLRDAFFKKCSATGEGLRSAVAGVPATFYIQCQDAFGDPAAAANFRVEIAGPVSMSPKPVQIATGFFQCAFTAIKSGSGSTGYTVSIYVGRGSSDYQDLIAGEDPAPYDNIHQPYVVTENPMPFALTVAPGATSPAGSVAGGTSLSLITAGTIGSFVITARDSFENRRPGGDTINVLIVRWNVKTNAILDVNEAPETGTVTDNSDGSYSTTYSITRAGLYQMQIQFGSVFGAGSPFILDVKTSQAELSKTYVYGQLIQVQAGVSSLAFVQTRDKYGNNIRVELDPADADGPDEIEFELCKSIGTDSPELQLELNAPCKGGEAETSIGRRILYGVGSDGKTVRASTGEFNYGLYQIIFFPYIAAPYKPRIKHNRVYPSCYFDTMTDPGVDAVNECLNAMAVADSARRKLNEPTLTVVEERMARRALADSDGQVAAFAEPEMQVAAYDAPSTRSGPGWGRRAAKFLTDSDLNMNITSLFKTPNNDLQLSLIITVPIVCAILAFAAELALVAYAYYHRRKLTMQMKGEESEWESHQAQIGGKGEDFDAGGSEEGGDFMDVPLQARQVNFGKSSDPSQALLIEMAAAGRISRHELSAARAMVTSDNSRVLGALDAHERSVDRTAALLKKMVATADAPPPADAANGNGHGIGNGASPEARDVGFGGDLQADGAHSSRVAPLLSPPAGHVDSPPRESGGMLPGAIASPAAGLDSLSLAPSPGSVLM
mmetsp:Transcript_20992/g.47350  ORF Transcript_20992/g.47350 Transcript_20992/m.47350 type:complete len:1186 (+) Transcript_20992:160-3717(+)